MATPPGRGQHEAALDQQLLELRGRVSAADDEIRELTGVHEAERSHEPADGDLGAISERLTELRALLQAKEREAQALRLQVQFARVAELRLEERHRVQRSAALQRELAAAAHKLPDTDHDELELENLLAEHAALEARVKRFQAVAKVIAERSLGGWQAIDEHASPLAASVAELALIVDGAIDGVERRWAADTRAEADADASGREDLADLERRIAATEAKLVRLRQGESGEAAPPTPGLSPQELAALHDEASECREAKAKLALELDALRRAVAEPPPRAAPRPTPTRPAAPASSAAATAAPTPEAKAVAGVPGLSKEKLREMYKADKGEGRAGKAERAASARRPSAPQPEAAAPRQPATASVGATPRQPADDDGGAEERRRYAELRAKYEHRLK